jgi:hypothetical protein
LRCIRCAAADLPVRSSSSGSRWLRSGWSAMPPG